MYVRVSSKEQEKEGFSIPAQRKLLQQSALDHGLEIVREFEDVETAKRSVRQAFTEMITFLAKSSCKVVLVEATNTFGVRSSNGVIRTVFRPVDGIEYWRRQ